MNAICYENGAAYSRPLTDEEISQLEADLAKPLTESDYVAAIQDVLDREARTRNYDSILSACTYATSAVPKFQAEGQACVLWRDAVWALAYETLAEVTAGTRPQPTMTELLSLMPAMEWPEV